VIRYILHFPAAMSRSDMERYVALWRDAANRKGAMDVALKEGIRVERIDDPNRKVRTWARRRQALGR